MIGLLVTEKGKITKADALVLNSSYCGVCRSLRTIYGEAFSFFVNYEARFIVLLSLAQSSFNEQENITCPIKGYVGKQSIIMDKNAMDFAAVATMLVVMEKIEDNYHDNKSIIWSLFQKIPRKSIEKTTYQYLEKLGFPIASIKEIRSFQFEVENSFSNITQYLEPTGQLFAQFFSHTAYLLNLPQNHTDLQKLGQSVGKIIVLIDAIDDFYLDRKLRRFNPLIEQWGLHNTNLLPVSMLSEICMLFSEEFSSINFVLNKGLFNSSQSAIENILTRGLPLKATKVMANLWYKNHWSGDFPEATFTPLSLLKCKVCGIPHKKTKIDKSHQNRWPSLWNSSQSIVNAQMIIKELGIQSINEYMFKSIFPSLYNE